MPKPSPEKLAAALRANLKRRKGPKGLEGPQDGRAPKRAPAADAPHETVAPPPPKPPQKQG
jgi:hypothetical protein